MGDSPTPFRSTHPEQPHYPFRSSSGPVPVTMQYGTLLEEDVPMFPFPRTDWVTLRGRITGAMLDAMIHRTPAA